MHLNRSQTWLLLLGFLCMGSAHAQVCVTQEAAIHSTPPESSFGTSVALDGNTAVVGASGDSTAGTNRGAAHVFVRSGTSWSLQAKLVPGGTGAQEYMGSWVAIDGDVVVAGAPGFSITGNPGAAYVFARNGTNWSEVQRLVASDGVGGDQFGFGVAAANGRIFVGARRHNLPQAPEAGAIYVFESPGVSWFETAKLIADDPTVSTNLGFPITADGDRVVSTATLQGANNSAYVFARSGSGWMQEALLTPVDAVDDDDMVGFAALDGNVLAVGAPWGEAGTDPTRGSVFIFERQGSSWNQTAIVNAADASHAQSFGTNVALEGGRLVVGAISDDDLFNNSGAAYLFHKEGTDWIQDAKFFSSNGSTFGLRLDLANSVAIVTSSVSFPNEPVGLYRFDPPPATYCTGKTSSLGCIPFMSWSGTPSVSATSAFMVRGEDLLPGEAAFVLYSSKKANLNFHGGKLCVKAPVQRWLPPVIAKADGSPPCSGVAKRDFNARVQSGIDPSLTAGQTVTAQWRQRDPQDPAGFGDGLTDAVLFTICP